MTKESDDAPRHISADGPHELAARYAQRLTERVPFKMLSNRQAALMHECLGMLARVEKGLCAKEEVAVGLRNNLMDICADFDNRPSVDSSADAVIIGALSDVIMSGTIHGLLSNPDVRRREEAVRRWR